MQKIGESELILKPDGSIYHLALKPGELAENIIVVGDPGRVKTISAFFDRVELTRENREIFTHTGTYRGKRLSVVSTGMGTDNIDIVLNEIDALFNVDLETRLPKKELTSLNIIRMGTSGALQPDVDVDMPVVSTHGVGLDGMLYYYDAAAQVIDDYLTSEFLKQTYWPDNFPHPYVVEGSQRLLNVIGEGLKQGMTATAPGFYGPQGRELRLKTLHPDINGALTRYNVGNHRIMNFEMETSALFGLSRLLGHNALTVCLIVANRLKKTFSKDYPTAMNKMVGDVLDKITAL